MSRIIRIMKCSNPPLNLTRLTARRLAVPGADGPEASYHLSPSCGPAAQQKEAIGSCSGGSGAIVHHPRADAGVARSLRAIR